MSINCLLQLDSAQSHTNKYGLIPLGLLSSRRNLTTKSFLFQDLIRPKERAYSGLQNKPGVELFGQVFIMRLHQEYGVVVGGSPDITKSSGGYSSYFERFGGYFRYLLL